MILREFVIQALRSPKYRFTYRTASGIIFGDDTSAEYLEQIGPELLPVVEGVILNEVPKWAPSTALMIGARGVLLAYLHTAAQCEYERAGDLLRRLPPSIMKDGLACVGIIWGPGSSKRLTPVPQWLKAALSDMASGTGGSYALFMLKFVELEEVPGLRELARDNGSSSGAA
jgi:hypothetical protein